MSSVVHDSFVLERTFPVEIERVFAAWATPEAKASWFGDDDQIEALDDYSLDFRPGGREHFAATAGGSRYDYDATIHDIVENSRIVWSYEMKLDGARMSVSVGTVELFGVPGGTRLVMTEHGAYLDGLDTGDQRAEGSKQLLDNLAAHLTGSAA